MKFNTINPAKLVNVGVGEIGVSNLPGHVLKTYALSSCVAIVTLAPRQRAVGLAHVALPESGLDRELASQKPGYFADTGIQALMQVMARYGCRPKDLLVKLIGGASHLDPYLRFDIGERNLLAIKEHLTRYQLDVVAEETGNGIIRTVTVIVDTGTVLVSSPGKGQWEI